MASTLIAWCSLLTILYYHGAVIFDHGVLIFVTCKSFFLMYLCHKHNHLAETTLTGQTFLLDFGATFVSFIWSGEIRVSVHWFSMAAYRTQRHGLASVHTFLEIVCTLYKWESSGVTLYSTSVLRCDILHLGPLSTAKPPGWARCPRLTSILLLIGLKVRATVAGRHPRSLNWPSLKLKSKTRRSGLSPLSEGKARGRLSLRGLFRWHCSAPVSLPCDGVSLCSRSIPRS